MRARIVLAFVLAFTASLRADTITLATLGDSLTDTYVGRPYAGDNLGWTDLLSAHRSDRVSVFNVAAAGSTSSDLIANGQHKALGSLGRPGVIPYATLTVGANDILGFVYQINPADPATFDPTPHVQRLVGNIQTAVTELKAAGALVVLGNVPDITNTPAMQQQLAGNPDLAALVSGMTQAVNGELKTLARRERLALVDLEGLNKLSQNPVVLDGVDVQSYLYAPDGFHPSTIGSALLANAELEALRIAYGVDVPRFSNADILGFAGLTGDRWPSTNYNVAVFVQWVPEPSGLVLAGLAVGAVVVARRRKR